MVQTALACSDRARYSKCHEGKDSPRRALYAISRNSRPVLIACDKYIDWKSKPMLASSHPPRTVKSFSRAGNMTNSIGKTALRLPHEFGTLTRPAFGACYEHGSTCSSLRVGPKACGRGVACPERSVRMAIWGAWLRQVTSTEKHLHPSLRPLQAGTIDSLV